MRSTRAGARPSWPRVCGSICLLVACSGKIDAGGGRNEPEGGAGSTQSAGHAGSARGGNGGATASGGMNGSCDPSTDAPVAPKPGVLPVRRLTRFEYDNTVRDLLGDTSRPSSSFPADDVGAVGFATAINTSELMVTTAMEAADKLATAAVAKLDALVSCAATGNDACAAEWIASFGRRAFRRPLTSDERADLLSLYTGARSQLGYDFKGGIRVVLTAMLQAPQFLYHWELGTAAPQKQPDGTIALGAYELASRLSYFLWGSMPDAALLDAAANGKLASRDDVSAQAKRLLADARGRDMVADFFGQLLHSSSVVSAEKDATKLPDWTAEVRASALAESRAFVQSVVLDGDAKWRTLLTAPFSFVDARTAKLYGVANVTATAPTKKDLPQGQRAGLLTQAAFLASQSGPADGAMITPIRRGRVIRSRLLCQDIPPPLKAITARDSNGTTTRERLSSHASDPQCAACHDRMDDLGFALEGYDVVGRWRTTDNGAPVDTHGEISGIGCDGPPKFANATELAQRLADAPEVADCAVANLVRYATAREETDGEVAALRAQLGRELDVRDALVRIATSDGFMRRVPSAGEVLP